MKCEAAAVNAVEVVESGRCVRISKECLESSEEVMPTPKRRREEKADLKREQQAGKHEDPSDKLPKLKTTATATPKIQELPKQEQPVSVVTR